MGDGWAGMRASCSVAAGYFAPWKGAVTPERSFLSNARPMSATAPASAHMPGGLLCGPFLPEDAPARVTGSTAPGAPACVGDAQVYGSRGHGSRCPVPGLWGCEGSTRCGAVVVRSGGVVIVWDEGRLPESDRDEGAHGHYWGAQTVCDSGPVSAGVFQGWTLMCSLWARRRGSDLRRSEAGTTGMSR
jgi:hypothetical protein